MKKSFLTLVVVAMLGVASQSCETSSSLEEMVVQKENGIDHVSPSSQDQISKPGGGD